MRRCGSRSTRTASTSASRITLESNWSTPITRRTAPEIAEAAWQARLAAEAAHAFDLSEPSLLRVHVFRLARRRATGSH